jgi:hypothetical protein
MGSEQALVTQQTLQSMKNAELANLGFIKLYNFNNNV